MSEQMQVSTYGINYMAAAPEGKIVKSDVSVAKNYLSDKEMRSLQHIVSGI